MERQDKYNRFQSFKLLAHSDRIKRIISIEGHIPNPVQWIIYPSNLCGYNCGHCIMKMEKENNPVLLTSDAMQRIPDDVKDVGIKTVIFSGGGDPLLNPMTPVIAKKLKDQGVGVGLNTQGYHLTDPMPYSFIRISMDAMNAETYKKVHGFDGFDLVVNNIKNIVELRSEGHKIELGLAFLITQDNYEEVVDFCKWAQQFEPDFIHLRPAFLDADYLNPGDNTFIRNKIVSETFGIRVAEAEKQWPNVYFRFDKFDGYWNDKLYTKCRANLLIAVTAADGSFLICQDRGITKNDEKLRWGNYNNETFRHIWWSKKHSDVLDSIDLKKCPRCVENGYNEIIEHCFMKDDLKMDLL